MSDLLGLDAAVRTLVDEQIEARVTEAIERALSQREQAERSPYMTTGEAAEFLRCSRQRIYDLISQGRLSRFKEGGTPENPRAGRTLVLRSEVEALVETERLRRPDA